MKKLLIVAISALVVVFGGFIAYNALTAPTKAPSAPVISEIPAPTDKPTAPTIDAPTGTYRIVSEASKATFSIFEMLRGEPKTVIGTTNNISGYVDADPTDLSKASIGEIHINARTFQTDSSGRDNTTRRMILKTEDDANEFIVFKPTTVSVDNTAVDLDMNFTFKITGDLTIAGITKETTFDGSGKFISDIELSGTAKTTVKRSDFNLIVPSFPFLADVADEVPLQIDFVAKK